MTDDPVALWRAGQVSPEIALARLLLQGDDISMRLADAPELLSLFERHRAMIGPLRDAARALDHDGPAGVAAIAARFDAAVAHAPEASVAAYSLGDPATLDRATTELLGWLEACALIGPDRDVFDLGCGIGRMTAPLARRCRSAVGLDVSTGMIRTAAARHPEVPFRVGSGRDLAEFPAAAFDLILGVDVFPYLVQARVADRHVADAARLLRPGGALAICNLSYRGVAADRETAQMWSERYGLALEVNAASPFALWDGVAFVFRRPA